jgi:hypothetical protein
LSEDFSYNLANVKAAVISHKANNLIKLLLNETSVIRHRSDADERCRFTVVAIDLGDRDVVAAFQSFDNAFDDVAFILQAVYAEQVQLNCQGTDNHKNILKIKLQKSNGNSSPFL